MFEKKYLEYMLRTEQSGKTLEDIIMNIKSVSKINISPDNNFNNINIIETFILQNKNYNIESLTNEAFRKNIDLLQAKIIIENNNLSYRMIKNSMLPELNLNTSFVLKGFTGKSRPSEWREAFQGISKSPDDYYEFFAGFDFSMPFLLPADRAKKMEIQYEKEKAEFDYLSRKETIHNELISILKNIDLLKKNIEASKRMEEIDEKRYKFAQTDYDNGNMDAENFSKIQDAYRFTQINRINLELQHISALLSLELKTGTLLETYGIDTSKFFKKG
ncbi:MAG TPA: hypothetical protein DC049_06895 [Spirochaetia bacterium]|nr:hypothetical protein [Spirochaetia bacterium]